MIQLKIYIGKKIISMDGITSITKLSDIGERQVDYRYSDPKEAAPKYNYFEITQNGVLRVLAVAGKVERYDVPDTAEKTDEWEMPDGNA